MLKPSKPSQTPGIDNMAISLKELIKDTNFSSLPKDTQDNLMTLLERINKIRDAWAHSMLVTSGLRTMAEHLAIYAAKGITDPSRIPMKSAHLVGAAVDISDPNRDLQAWCKANEALLGSVGLWMEDFSATSSPSAWCHFQVYPPKSGKRWFMP